LLHLPFLLPALHTPNFFLHALHLYSVSGYFRNNKIIKHQAQAKYFKSCNEGNSTTSYGNVHLWSILTPAGDATDLDNLQSSTFVV
jgi:hypothetical protein